MGSAKKTLLKRLPDKLKAVIKPESEETVIKLWKVTNAVIKNKDLQHVDKEPDESLWCLSNSYYFDKLYALLGQNNLTSQDVRQYFFEVL